MTRFLPALAALLLAAGSGRADMTFSYTTSVTPYATLGAASGVQLSGTYGTSSSVPSTIVLANLVTATGPAPAGASATGDYSGAVAFATVVNGVPAANSLLFGGMLADSATGIANTFTTAAVPMALAGSMYDVTLGYNAPAPGTVGSITASFVLDTTGTGSAAGNAPEPSSLLLGFLALPCAGLLRRRLKR